MADDRSPHNNAYKIFFLPLKTLRYLYRHIIFLIKLIRQIIIFDKTDDLPSVDYILIK